MTSVTLSKCLGLLPLTLFLVLALLGSSFALKCYVCEKIVPWCVTPVCPASLVGSDGVCLSVWEQDPSAGTSKRVLKGCESAKITRSTGGRNSCAVMKGSKFLEVYKQDFPKTKEELIKQLQNAAPDLLDYWREIYLHKKEDEKDPDIDPDEELLKNDIDPKKTYEVCTCDKDLCNPGEARKLESGAISGLHVEIWPVVVFFAAVIALACILHYGF